MKHSIEKMRACLAQLPPPGGDVVAECLDEIDELRQQLAEANHVHEFMSQQYLDAIKERNQLRKDVAKLQEALHCKLTWKPS